MCTCQVWKLQPPRPSQRLPRDPTTRVTVSTNCVCATTGSSFWHPPKGSALLMTTVLCVGDATSRCWLAFWGVQCCSPLFFVNPFLPTAVRAVPFPCESSATGRCVPQPVVLCCIGLWAQCSSFPLLKFLQFSYTALTVPFLLITLSSYIL